MTRGIFYKGIIILLVVCFAVILILPTLGTKKMEIILNDGATQEEISRILERFPADEYDIEKTDGMITVSASFIKISDASMNEARILPGVKDAIIQPHWAEKAVLAKPVTLGLDLQGGMHLVLMADFEKIKNQHTFEKETLLKKKAELESREKTDKNKDEINKEIEETDFYLKDITKNKFTGSGELTETYKSEITSQALEMLRNRIDKFGVSEPIILPRGNDAIEIQLPGVKDPKAVRTAIGTPGSVQYRLVDDTMTAKAMEWLANNFKGKELPDDPGEQGELLSKISGEIELPFDLEVLFFYDRDKETDRFFPSRVMALQRKVAVAGSDMSKAWVGRDEYGDLCIHFRTTPEGAAKFAKVTAEENKGKKLAIVFDDKIRSAPNINDPIVTGTAYITGGFNQSEVTALARIIQEGALPVDLNIVEERTVGPSLGNDSIESGTTALLVGLAFICLFMLIWYKFAGFISVIGLFLNMIIIFALLSWLGFTLTLPGIAGLILTTGMAIDSNVIIYERIKDELKAGKAVRMAITNGFEKAFSAIFDANLTTLIAMLVLTQYGTGFIKGFAVTLSVGTLSTMFVALFITKYIYQLIGLKKNLKKISI